jgi:hypothetical protein
MPDIMMCRADCSGSKQCYRHADSGTKACEGRQCYWAREEADPVYPECPVFWQVTPMVKAVHDGSLS